jgi:hypothetical protein
MYDSEALESQVSSSEMTLKWAVPYMIPRPNNIMI